MITGHLSGFRAQKGTDPCAFGSFCIAGTRGIFGCLRVERLCWSRCGSVKCPEPDNGSRHILGYIDSLGQKAKRKAV